MYFIFCCFFWAWQFCDSLHIMDYMPPCTDRKLMKQTAEHHETLQLFDNVSIPAYVHETLLFSTSCFGKREKDELQLLVAKAVSGEVVSCPVFPHIIGRPWAVKFLNSTTIYLLLTKDDTDFDHNKIGNMVVISVENGTLVARRHGVLPGASHDAFVEVRNGSLEVTWIKTSVVPVRIIRECGLHEYMESLHTKNISNYDGLVRADHVQVFDVVCDNLVHGRKWRINGIDLLLALAGWPNCSEVTKNRQFFQPIDPLHLNSIWPTKGGKIVLNGLTLLGFVFLRPGSPAPVEIVGTRRQGAALANSLRGHLTLPVSENSFVHFDNNFRHGEAEHSPWVDRPRVMRVTVGHQVVQQDWIVYPPKSSAYPTGGGAFLLPEDMLFVSSTKGSLHLYNVQTGTLLAQRANWQIYHAIPFLRAPYFKILNVSVISEGYSICMSTGAMYWDSQPSPVVLSATLHCGSKKCPTTTKKVQMLEYFRTWDVCMSLDSCSCSASSVEATLSKQHLKSHDEVLLPGGRGVTLK